PIFLHRSLVFRACDRFSVATLFSNTFRRIPATDTSKEGRRFVLGALVGVSPGLERGDPRGEKVPTARGSTVCCGFTPGGTRRHPRFLACPRRYLPGGGGT